MGVENIIEEIGGRSVIIGDVISMLTYVYFHLAITHKLYNLVISQ